MTTTKRSPLDDLGPDRPAREDVMRAWGAVLIWGGLSLSMLAQLLRPGGPSPGFVAFCGFLAILEVGVAILTPFVEAIGAYRRYHHYVVRDPEKGRSTVAGLDRNRALGCILAMGAIHWLSTPLFVGVVLLLVGAFYNPYAGVVSLWSLAQKVLLTRASEQDPVGCGGAILRSILPGAMLFVCIIPAVVVTVIYSSLFPETAHKQVNHPSFHVDVASGVWFIAMMGFYSALNTVPDIVIIRRSLQQRDHNGADPEAAAPRFGKTG